MELLWKREIGEVNRTNTYTIILDKKAYHIMNLDNKCGQGIVTPLRRINEISGWWQGVEDDANSSDQMEEMSML